MLVSILIIAFSTVLFLYWFRATCGLLLRNHAEQCAAAPIEASDRFSFPQVEVMLKSEPELGSLHRLLNQDFRVLTYLREHAATFESSSLEDRLLILDYRIMQWYFRLMHTAVPSQARSALAEMTTVVGVLAYKLGMQAGT